jgi:hypothetical protein
LEGLPIAKTSLAGLLERPDRAELMETAEALILADFAAETDEMGRVIFELLIMYPDFDRRGEASKTMVINQWRKSLAGWPLDILEQAAQQYINGEKAGFVPQPGDIIKHCETIGRFRRALAKKARDFLDLCANKASATDTAN